MGITHSNHLSQTKAPTATACIVCDDCGRVFTVAQEITSGTDKKKRCERYIYMLNETVCVDISVLATVYKMFVIYT